MSTYKFLSSGASGFQDIWSWAKKLIQDLNARDSQISSLGTVDVGAVMFWLSDTVPSGWLLCDGAAYQRANQPKLFLQIGYTYGGAGDTFNVPDFRNRLLMGAGATVGLNAMAGSTAKTILETNLPAHKHGVLDPGHTHTFVGDPHTHGVTDPGHLHTITDPGHIHAIADPGHVHAAAAAASTGTAGAAAVGAGAGNTGAATTGITINNHTTGITIDTHVTGISNDNFTATGTNLASYTGVQTDLTGGGVDLNVLNPVFGVHAIIKC